MVLLSRSPTFGWAVVRLSCEWAVFSRSVLWVVLFFLLSTVGRCCFLLLGRSAFLPSSFRWLHVLICQSKVSFPQSNFHNNTFLAASNNRTSTTIKGPILHKLLDCVFRHFSLSKYSLYIYLLNFPRVFLFVFHICFPFCHVLMFFLFLVLFFTSSCFHCFVHFFVLSHLFFKNVSDLDRLCMCSVKLRPFNIYHSETQHHLILSGFRFRLELACKLQNQSRFVQKSRLLHTTTSFCAPWLSISKP